MRARRLRKRMTLLSVLLTGLAVAPAASADDHVRGFVAGRGDDGTVTVRTDDSRTISVVLADSTKIRRYFGTRTIRMSSATLTPGLRVHVTGRYQREDFLIADRVTFSTSSLKTARAIDAAAQADRRGR